MLNHITPSHQKYTAIRVMAKTILASLSVMATIFLLSSRLVPPALAACTPGQQGVDLADCLTDKNGQPISTTFSKPTDLLNLGISTIFVAAGVIFLALIVYAGFKFIQSGTKGKDEAKTILTTAVIGLIVMLSAYWIVRIVETVVGQQILF